MIGVGKRRIGVGEEDRSWVKEDQDLTKIAAAR